MRGSELPDAKTQMAVLFGGQTAASDNGSGETYRLAEMALRDSGWLPEPKPVKDALMHFLVASELDVPNSKNARKDWHATLQDHIDDYGETVLAELYPVAVEQLRDRGMTVGRPGALTKTLPDVARELKDRGGRKKRPAKLAADYVPGSLVPRV